MNKISYSPEALNDLDDIWAYISNELKNPNAAQNTINSILDNIEILREFSGIGALLSSVTDIESDYRFLVCGNYLAFYRTTNKDVYIDRILYGKRNYISILFGISSEETIKWIIFQGRLNRPLFCTVKAIKNALNF